MSRAKILFYKENYNPEPIFEKVVTANGLSKSQFTDFLFSEAREVCRIHGFEWFSVTERIDTIEEVKK